MWTLILMILCLSQAVAQEKDLATLIADIAESVADKAEDEDEIMGMEQLVEHYTHLAENPVNINDTAAVEELEQLLILTDFQIFSIIEYIKEFGLMMSVHELSLVPGFDDETVMRISPFVTTAVAQKQSFKPSFKDMLTKGRNTLLMRSTKTLETREGYIRNDPELQRYEGSPFSFLTRYKYKYGNKLQIGITADKDAGEEFFKGSNRQGFDFYSFHLMLNDRGHLKKLLVGDFRANFGQGLALWNNFAFGKSGDVHSIKRRNNGFSAYSSTDEVTYMRGIASSWQFGYWDISPFVSYRKVDATMEGEGYTSLSATGMHRTSNEIARKNALSETVAGINAGYGKTFWRVGATALYGRYGAEDYRDIRPYNKFALHKPENANFAVDYRAIIKNISLFGEAAISSNGGKALLAGITADVNHWLQFSSLYRNYQTYYQAVYANAFGENSSTANEQGLYLGLSVLPHKNWKLSAFFDSYSFPWLRYGIDSPSSGWDYLVQANYTPSKDFDMRIKVQCDKAMKNVSDNALVVAQNVERTRVLLQATYSLSPELSMGSRFAFGFFNPEMQAAEKGFLMSQDVKYKMKNIPLSFVLRYAIFDTDSWNTRLYVYESDILYAFSIPAYYDRGCRYYLNIGYKIADTVQLWFRISQTYYFEKDEISSGLSAIEGNRQTDAKLQLQIKF
ncbi:MAG: helix-hairpin-helix domain-containing protein [Prevotellaceae bacterium]|nr:helix-hairpin-helix domain-containing protein [Prevotellaceae bacterium]